MDGSVTTTSATLPSARVLKTATEPLGSSIKVSQVAPLVTGALLWTGWGDVVGGLMLFWPELETDCCDELGEDPAFEDGEEPALAEGVVGFELCARVAACEDLLWPGRFSLT